MIATLCMIGSNWMLQIGIIEPKFIAGTKLDFSVICMPWPIRIKCLFQLKKTSQWFYSLVGSTHHYNGNWPGKCPVSYFWHWCRSSRLKSVRAVIQKFITIPKQIYFSPAIFGKIRSEFGKNPTWNLSDYWFHILDHLNIYIFQFYTEIQILEATLSCCDKNCMG